MDWMPSSPAASGNLSWRPSRAIGQRHSPVDARYGRPILRVTRRRSPDGRIASNSAAAMGSVIDRVWVAPPNESRISCAMGRP